MILLAHPCGYKTSIVEWDALPILGYSPLGEIMLVLRICPGCSSTITAGSLQLAGVEENRLTYNRIESTCTG